ncbi:MAG TPA: hypothetical protein EYP04_00935 [Anaerolineae bacterium]|nr:hypothetical protein [Anaerolineae bacterium]HIQ05687.1 hypothetical protein [Anaerolineae bacterium]
MNTWLTFTLIFALSALLWLAVQAGRVWTDARRRGFPPRQRLWLAAQAALFPDRYWWDARLHAMPAEERDALLRQGAARLGLQRVDGLRCPLCGQAEIERAWALTKEGKLTVPRREVTCPACDFRLDSCRHCAHFLPGERGAGRTPGLSWGAETSIAYGRCNAYKEWQPVRELYAPDMVRQLESRGFSSIRAPKRIVDSYIPLEACRAFELDLKRLRANGVPSPGKTRRRLLKLLALVEAETGDQEGRPEEPPLSEEEMWLL